MTDYVGGSARELTPKEMAEIKRLTRELERALYPDASRANACGGMGRSRQVAREAHDRYGNSCGIGVWTEWEQYPTEPAGDDICYGALLAACFIAILLVAITIAILK